MANAILAYGNKIDDATLSGGSWLAALPLDNLKDRRIGKVARSTSPSPGSTQFDADYGGTRLLRLVAIVNHNLSLDAEYRIRLSIDPAFATTVADSGWLPVWPVVNPFGTITWGDPNWWTGQISQEEQEAYTSILTYILPTSVNARYMRIELSDPTNPDGYVQLGRPFTANGWQPVRNMVYGASLQWENRSEVSETLSGAEYFNERAAPRVARFELQAMTESEAMAIAFEIQRSSGITREIFYVWDPEDTVHALRRQFMGRLRQLSPIENPGPNRWRSPFEIKELL